MNEHRGLEKVWGWSHKGIYLVYKEDIKKEHYKMEKEWPHIEFQREHLKKKRQSVEH